MAAAETGRRPTPGSIPAPLTFGQIRLFTDELQRLHTTRQGLVHRSGGLQTCGRVRNAIRDLRHRVVPARSSVAVALQEVALRTSGMERT